LLRCRVANKEEKSPGVRKKTRSSRKHPERSMGAGRTFDVIWGRETGPEGLWKTGGTKNKLVQVVRRVRRPTLPLAN